MGPRHVGEISIVPLELINVADRVEDVGSALAQSIRASKMMVQSERSRWSTWQHQVTPDELANFEFAHE